MLEYLYKRGLDSKAVRYFGMGASLDYYSLPNHLKSLGLYEVMHEGKPYKYGHAWLYRPIPEADLKRIWTLLNI